MFKKGYCAKGEVLAQLDPTRFASNVGESKSLLVSSQATAARLRAEVNGTPLVFPEEVLKEPKLVRKKPHFITLDVKIWNSR
jgi:adhesin transport system membrane fusion protein